MPDPIDALIRDFAARGSKSDSFDRAMDIALNHPEWLARLAISVMEQLPQGASFHEAALNFLPMPDWFPVVEYALKILEDGGANEAAEAVLACASLQCLPALHAHLRTIWGLVPNADYFE